MSKNNRPEIENPLAGMGLDDIVRGITSTPKAAPQPEEPGEEEAADLLEEETEAEEPQAKQNRPRRGNAKVFEDYIKRYKGIKEQGIAVWLPRDVKKRLEIIRVSADRNIPLRALAAAIIMSYIDENEERLSNL